MTRVQTQWSVLYVCGHRQKHDLTNVTPRDRESRACWLATRVCTNCWKSLTPEWISALGPAPAVTDAWTQVRPVPLLIESPKQVTWATSLRVTLLTCLWAHHATFEMDPDVFAGRVELPAIVIHEVSLGDLKKVLHGVPDGLPNAADGGSDFAAKTNHESDRNRCNYLHGGFNR
jgi:hypothetical protein